MDKKTRKLMKKLSQINQLNNPNENTVNCDYYDLNGFNKVSNKVRLSCIASQHLFTLFPP